MMKYMVKQYNLYNFEASFKEFLLAGNTLPISVKNYLSDLRHFFGWLTIKLNLNSSPSNDSTENYNSPSFTASFISKEIVKQYQDYLVSNSIPVKTINRRLSALRKFCVFCISQGWMTENPAKQVMNSKSAPSFSLENNVLNEYQAHLTDIYHDNKLVNEHLQVIKSLLNI